ncbi:retropepsin-like aspartic protease [Bdellovibrionota bacterium FG-2]
MKAIHCPDSRSENSLGVDVFQEAPVQFDFVSRTIRFSQIVFSKGRPLEKSAGGHFLIPVKVGERTVMAVWDTDAGTSVIDQKMVSEMPELFTKGITVIAVDTVGAEKVTPIFLAKNISIGDIQIPPSNFLAREFSTTRENVRSDVAMILGINIIRHYVWDFDPVRKAWEILKPIANNVDQDFGGNYGRQTSP